MRVHFQFEILVKYNFCRTSPIFFTTKYNKYYNKNDNDHNNNEDNNRNNRKKIARMKKITIKNWWCVWQLGWFEYEKYRNISWKYTNYKSLNIMKLNKSDISTIILKELKISKNLRGPKCHKNSKVWHEKILRTNKINPNCNGKE